MALITNLIGQNLVTRSHLAVRQGNEAFVLDSPVSNENLKFKLLMKKERTDFGDVSQSIS